MSELRNRAATSVKWVGAATLSRAGAMYGSLLLTSQHMTAEEFGVFNIALLIMGYGQTLADGGLRDTLIFRQDLNRRLFSTVVWMSAAFSVVMFLVFWTGSGIAAAIFHMPALTVYMPLIAFGIGVLTFGGPFQALLEKNLEFGIQGTLDIVGAAVLLGTVLVVLAVVGSGIQALMIGNIVYAVVRTGLLVLAGTRRMKVALVFCWGDAREVLGFGIFRSLEGILLQSVRRMDQILIALFFGPAVVGAYAFAWQLVVDPVAQLNAIFNRVLFPSLVQLRPHPERLSAAYIGGVRMIALVTTPLPVFASAAAALYVPMLFGPHWSSAVALMPFLAPMAAMRAVINPVGSLMVALGHPRRMLLWQAGVATGTFTAMLPALLTHDIRLVLVGICAAYIVTFVCHVLLLIRPALPGLDVRSFFKRIFVLPLVATMAEYGSILGVMAALRDTPALAVLAVAAVAGGVSYLLLYGLLARPLLRDLVHFATRSGPLHQQPRATAI
jgi:O-antigen/teichoic acid export membrane protein